MIFAKLGFRHCELQRKEVSGITENLKLKRLIAIYPRFLFGRGLIAVVFVLGVTTDDLNSSPEPAFAALDAASSFDSFSVFNAALAFLLNLFFSFGIMLLVDSARRSFSPLPCLGIPFVVNAGRNDHIFIFDKEEKRVRKAFHHRPSNLPVNHRKQKGI